MPFIITSTDFKAYVPIHRGKMMKILSAYRIPSYFLRAIEKICAKTKARVMSPDGETDLFDITVGVLQWSGTP